MTNNDNLKNDATELLLKLQSFKRKYMVKFSSKGSPIDEFERELRMILYVARTDEENQQQIKTDSYC